MELRVRSGFVCTRCVVRAVHLDFVPDISARTSLRTFKQFTARRGLPSRVISDNRKAFKAAAKTIQAVLGHKHVKRYFSGLGMKWVFNIPKAPSHGGEEFSKDGQVYKAVPEKDRGTSQAFLL